MVDFLRTIRWFIILDNDFRSVYGRRDSFCDWSRYTEGFDIFQVSFVLAVGGELVRAAAGADGACVGWPSSSRIRQNTKL